MCDASLVEADHINSCNMGPKAQARAQKMEVAEDSLEEGAVGGVPLISKPQEEQLHPETTDLVSIAGLLQECVRFQRDMGDRWEKESIKLAPDADPNE